MSPRYFIPTTINQIRTDKCIDIKCYVIKQKVQDQNIKVEHIITIRCMSVNPLTKGIISSVLRQHVAS